ncbi:hypothetical protein, partial [Acinetobacter baumannii]
CFCLVLCFILLGFIVFMIFFLVCFVFLVLWWLMLRGLVLGLVFWVFWFFCFFCSAGYFLLLILLGVFFGSSPDVFLSRLE